MKIIDLFNGTQPWEILTYVDKITNYWFGDGMIIIIWLTAFLAFGVNYPKNKAFAGATYLIMPLALIFWYIDILNFGMIIILIALIILSIIFLGGTDRS